MTALLDFARLIRYAQARASVAYHLRDLERARAGLAKAYAARDAAGYRTGVSQGNRCDACADCRASHSPLHTTRYDRSCLRWHVRVKTHGTCARWRAK